MTQRTFIETPALRGPAAPLSIPFGEAVATVFGALFGPSSADGYGLPPEALRDHDPALYNALSRHRRTRLALDADRRPLLY
jgi:hypothetical protein